MIGKLFRLVVKATLLLVLFVVALGFLVGKGSPRPSPELVAAPAPGPPPAPVLAPAEAGPAEPLAVGTLGTLELEGQQAVWMARSEPDYHAMVTAEATLYDRRPNRPAGGGAAIYRLAEPKRVRAYAIGTRVRVLEDLGKPLVVQVVDGEDKGARGWVQRDMVRVEKADREH